MKDKESIDRRQFLGLVGIGSLVSFDLLGNNSFIPFLGNNGFIGSSVPVDSPFIPDNEDLTLNNNILKFKDKEYDNSNYSGLGKIYLRKNVISGVNTLTQEMINQANTIYIFQYDYVLGEEIKVPANCVLQFDGGSISEGTINGNDTCIKWNGAPFFKGRSIVIGGSWRIPFISTSMFDSSSSTNMLKQVFNLTSEKLYNKVVIEEGVYSIAIEKNYWNYTYGWSEIKVKSNTDLIIDGTLQLEANSYPRYTMLGLKGVENVRIFGSGSLIGDMKKHGYNNSRQETKTHEWGSGIVITACNNISVEGIKVIDFTGDSIDIIEQLRFDYEHLKPTSTPSTNISIKGVCCKGSRRGGIGIGFVTNLIIENCSFYGIYNTFKGTAPGFAIDIEANEIRESNIEFSNEINNIVIRNCIIQKCRNGIISGPDYDIHDSRSYKNIRIDNCSFRDVTNCIIMQYMEGVNISSYSTDGKESNGIYLSHCSNVSINNSQIKQTIQLHYGVKYIKISNCLIKPLKAQTRAFYLAGGDVENIELTNNTLEGFTAFSNTPNGYYYRICSISNNVFKISLILNTIHCFLSGNVFEFGESSTGTQFLLCFNSSIDSYNTVIGNIFDGSSGSKSLKKYGVMNRSSYNNIIYNTFKGPLISALQDNGSHNTFERNSFIGAIDSQLDHYSTTGAVISYGKYANKPKPPLQVGFSYFATDLGSNGRPIYWSGKTNIGDSGWVDSNGENPVIK